MHSYVPVFIYSLGLLSGVVAAQLFHAGMLVWRRLEPDSRQLHLSGLEEERIKSVEIKLYPRGRLLP